MYSHEVKTFGIVIFESLYSNEIKTGTELKDGLLKYKKFQVDEMDIVVIEISTKKELLDGLIELRRKVEEEFYYPIIQFEIHGYDDGICTNKGECISWSEIVPLLSEINVLLRNTLLILLGVCKGASIIKYTSLEKRAPFRSLIGSSGDLTTKQIQEGFHAFYDTFFFSMDILESTKVLRDKIGSDQIGIMLIEDIFDQIFDPKRDESNYKRMMKINKEELLEKYPMLKNVEEVKLNKIAEKILLEIYDAGKETRSFYLMEDLNDEEKQKEMEEFFAAEKREDKK